MEDEFSIMKKPKSKEEIEREKERRKQRRLDIRAIEFDWIFNKTEGAGFMKTLADTQCIDLFSLHLVRHIIRFCWSYYRKYIVIYLLIPFLVYFSVFIMYATYFHKKQYEEAHADWKKMGIANSLSLIVIMMFSIYFAFFEVRQMLFHKISYFTSFWNMLDLISLALNFLI
jgi:hypothetical protein